MNQPLHNAHQRQVEQAHAIWIEFFSTLADGARILDLGTGDGTVALVAQQTAMNLKRTWEIDATDPADVDPRHVTDGKVQVLGVTLHPGVANEKLPFADGRFDAVSGHCALEYPDTAGALAEVHRVLKHGGDAQFVLHHAGSVLIDSARASVREAALVFNQTKVFRQLHTLLGMSDINADTEVASTDLRTSIKTLKQALEQARQHGAGDLLTKVLDAIQKLLAARNDMSAQAAALEVDRAEAQMRASIDQLKAMIEHARSAEDMDALEQQAAEAGFSQIERMPCWHADKMLVGWQLLLHRA